MSHRKYKASDLTIQLARKTSNTVMRDLPKHGEIKTFNKLILQHRSGAQVSKQSLDALLERMNKGKDIEQGMDLLVQLYRYL